MIQDGFLDVSSILLQHGVHHGVSYLQGSWARRRRLNIPGPLYCADVDNSGPGPAEAPNNVLIDEQGYPFVFRQPVNLFELRQVLLAAENDPFMNYGADGDQHWNRSSICDWWKQHRDFEALASAQRDEHLTSGHIVPWYLMALDRWRDYLQDGAEFYLRIYAFFLEEGRIPRSDDNLPEL